MSLVINEESPLFKMNDFIYMKNKIEEDDDVQKGDAITLYVDETGASYFYFNQQYLGVINDPVFSEQFAAIWLSEKTTRPGFRDKLLGRDK